MSKFTERLQLPHEVRKALDAIPLPPNHLELKASFFAKTQPFSAFASADPTGLTVLKLYLQWALGTQARYHDLQIPDPVFWDSMQDFPIWCADYITKYGTPGFKEWEWLGKSLRLEVIRLGRLQFEPILLSQEVTLGETTFAAGTPVLDVHIPTGAPLDKHAALESMQQAPAFFKKYFGKTFPLFHCHSWLLSPDLKELLPDSSRIIQFQDLFTVYKTDNEERQAEDRIFGFLSDDPQAYPAATSLQANARRHLLDGGSILMGAGIRIME